VSKREREQTLRKRDKADIERNKDRKKERKKEKRTKE